MTSGSQALSDGERAVLRLLAQGHDAKSSARELDVSVHAINERLRTARRKLGVTSSREAARLLARAEPQRSNSLVHKKIELASSRETGAAAAHDGEGKERAYVVAVGGLCIMFLVILIALLATTSSHTAESGSLPNWGLRATMPAKLSRQSNRVHLSGNRLLWNGYEASEANVRTFLTVEMEMSPQPLTILTYGPRVVPQRVERIRQLMDDVLHCKPATCLEVTSPIDDDGSAPSGPRGHSISR